MTLTLIRALLLGLFQGVAELFPVSSLAQIILLPTLLGWWTVDNKPRFFLEFLVALHLATAVALVIYFWKDWKAVVLAYIGSIKKRQLVYDQSSKFAWLLVAGTIVVGAAGVLLERHVRPLFENPKHAWIVATVLILNGFMMIGADALKKHKEKKAAQQKNAEDLTFAEATVVGAAQTLALVPGISRSGVTIVGGLLAGLNYEEATRFSFMLATPVIGLAALKEVPTLFHHDAHAVLKVAIPAAIVAGITAYVSTAFLMRYFKHNRLSPFGWFCVVFGVMCLMLLH